MSQITVEVLSQNLAVAFSTAKANHNAGCVVVMGKRSDGVSVVCQLNRKGGRFLKVGYCRFGHSPIWTDKDVIPNTNIEAVKYWVDRCLKLADETQAALKTSKFPLFH